jgi:hypothetical protein
VTGCPPLGPGNVQQRLTRARCDRANVPADLLHPLQRAGYVLRSTGYEGDLVPTDYEAILAEPQTTGPRASEVTVGSELARRQTVLDPLDLACYHAVQSMESLVDSPHFQPRAGDKRS